MVDDNVVNRLVCGEVLEVCSSLRGGASVRNQFSLQTLGITDTQYATCGEEV